MHNALQTPDTPDNPLQAPSDGLTMVVCMKAVPSSNTVRMDPVTNTIVRDGRQAVVNPFDATALEEALCIRSDLGGTITALSMGIPDTVRLLRDAIARGADRGLLLSDRAFAGADTLATSYALSCAVRQLGHVDLILCGKMAVDGDTAQIGPELAGALGIPCITDVCEVLEVTTSHIRVKRATDRGFAQVQTDLPALITLQKDVRVPHMPSIAGILKAEQAPVSVLNAAAAGADSNRTGLTGSPTQVVRSFTPERDHEALPLTGTPAEQAAALLNIIKEMGL